MDSEQKIEQITLYLNNLNPFLDYLRLCGYRIGVGEYISIQKLLLHLSQNGNLPLQFDELERFLSPILCSSKQEQSDFKYQFKNYVEILFEHKADKKVKTQEKLLFKGKLYIIAFISLSFLLIISAFQYINYYANNEKNSPVISKQNTIDELQPKLLNSQQQNKEYFILNKIYGFIKNRLTLICAVLVFFIGYLYFFVWRIRYIKRVKTDQDVIKRKISIKKNSRSPSFLSIELDRAAQNYNKHIQKQATYLNIEKTVKSVCDNAGLFTTPIYDIKYIVPEYLILIDRNNSHDFHSNFVDELLIKLTENEVYIEKYYFDGEPQFFSSSNFNRTSTIEDLEAKYPGHRLLIFTDAEWFIDPNTGNLTEYAIKLNFWNSRSILFFGAEKEFLYRKNVFLNNDFIVMPACQLGLAALSTMFTENDLPHIPYPISLPLPATLQTRTVKWIDRHLPSVTQVSEMLKEVRQYLGDNAYEWFSACAIYPEINWKMTLYLGQELGCLSEKNLIALSKLPWFRQGRLPDWLRRRLIDDMPKKNEKNIRKILTNLFIETNNDAHLSLSEYKNSFIKRLYKTIVKSPTDNNRTEDQLLVKFIGNSLSFRISKSFHRIMESKNLINSFATPLLPLTSVAQFIFQIISRFNRIFLSDLGLKLRTRLLSPIFLSLLLIILVVGILFFQNSQYSFSIQNKFLRSDAVLVIQSNNWKANQDNQLNVEFDGFKFSKAAKPVAKDELGNQIWNFKISDFNPPDLLIKDGAHKIRLGFPGKGYSEEVYQIYFITKPLFIDATLISNNNDSKTKLLRGRVATGSQLKENTISVDVVFYHEGPTNILNIPVRLVNDPNMNSVYYEFETSFEGVPEISVDDPRYNQPFFELKITDKAGNVYVQQQSYAQFVASGALRIAAGNANIKLNKIHPEGSANLTAQLTYTPQLAISNEPPNLRLKVRSIAKDIRTLEWTSENIQKNTSRTLIYRNDKLVAETTKNSYIDNEKLNSDTVFYKVAQVDSNGVKYISNNENLEVISDNSKACLLTEKRKKPSWINQPPQNDHYLYGIGIAPRQKSVTNQIQAAKILATRNISQKISAYIKSQYQKTVKDIESKGSTTIGSHTKRTAESLLKRVKIIDKWNDVENCNIYVLTSVEVLD